jgi:hypothetical protein
MHATASLPSARYTCRRRISTTIKSVTFETKLFEEYLFVIGGTPFVISKVEKISRRTFSLNDKQHPLFVQTVDKSDEPTQLDTGHTEIMTI